MATYTTLSALFTAIANAIRAKTGGSANIVADNFPTAIAAITGGGTPTINGKTFDCGTFTPASNITANYTVSHALGRISEFLGMWAGKNDYSLPGTIGKWNNATATTYTNIGIVSANSSIASSSGGASSLYRSSANSTTATFNCDSTRPLLAGVKYQWLVI